jgi:hypothetical protein
MISLPLLPWKNDSLALRWQVGCPAPYKPPKNNPVAALALVSAPLNLAPDVPIDLTYLQGKNWIYVVIESRLLLPSVPHKANKANLGHPLL